MIPTWAKTTLTFLAILLASFLYLLPLRHADNPYFSHEDDAHHFNRTVEMFKSGDFNPHYFNKPSLHFYLRQPALAIALNKAKGRGELKSSRELRTRDPYGLAGYAFTASHPSILSASRAFSIFLSACLIAATFLLTSLLTKNCYQGVSSVAVTCFSLEVVRNSAVIGVDILMALMIVLSVIFALAAIKKGYFSLIVTSATFAGLAVSSKYNAAPIVAVPIFTALVLSRKKELSTKKITFQIGLTLTVAVAAFLLGSPYILLSFSEFVTALSYEIHHYRVAGHVGHEASPGIDQAIFYFNWLISDGVGVICTIFSAFGFVSIFKQRDRSKAAVFLLFPVIYIGMMVMQKANFTRNMVVIIPFVAALGSEGIVFLARYYTKRFVRVFFCMIAFIGVGLENASRSHAFILAKSFTTESRTYLIDWITSAKPPSDDIAIAGQLQIPITTFVIPGVDAFSPDSSTPAALFNDGYSLFALPSHRSVSWKGLFPLTETRFFQGERGLQRIPLNPEITLLSVSNEEDAIAAISLTAPLTTLVLQNGKLTCVRSAEDYCWASHRVSKLELSDALSNNLEVMTPWQNQSIKVLRSGHLPVVFNIPRNKWVPIELPAGGISKVMVLSQVHSPSSQGISKDYRRLGIAFRLNRTLTPKTLE